MQGTTEQHKQAWVFAWVDWWVEGGAYNRHSYWQRQKCRSMQTTRKGIKEGKGRESDVKESKVQAATNDKTSREETKQQEVKKKVKNFGWLQGKGEKRS